MEQVAEVVLQPVKSWVVPKVEEQFSYVFSNKKHIEELDKEVKSLENKKLEIATRVEDAKRQGETIIPRVDDWQKEADEIITDSQKFLEESRNSDASCFFKLCYNVIHLYKSGKEAAMLHKKVTDKYQEATKFGVVATPLPAAPIVVSSAATSGEEFRSREKILNEVISALKNDTIDVVGIHGMGGVGKTTLVDKLILQAKEQKLFNVVVKAAVSKTIDIRGIQNQIADKIQYKFQAESTQGRRDELCQILSQKTQNDGKILVILDDVWEAIDITTQIGIPRMKCCKVLIASRIVDILRGWPINARRLFKVGVMEDEEAKVLFAKSLGDYYSTIANDSQYTTIMRGLLERCGGLPLALVTLAGALTWKDHHIWKDAFLKLSKHSGRKIEGMSEKVWSTIMFSFDSLQDEEVMKVLLLCSLFPEDADIPVQKLVSYGFGIDLFDDSCRLDEAMRQVHGYIDKLVSCSLLLSVEPEDESDSYCVRMHDVIRDVAHDIASQDHYNFFIGTSLPKGKNLHAISLSIKDSENMGGHLLDVSNLKVLRLQCKQKVSISIDFFKGMEKLKVLDLVVDNVMCFSILDPLTSLEHLFLEDHMITNLMTTFEGFKCLKVLDLSRCRSSMKIPTNFVAGLLQLEGLLLANEQVINLVDLQWCPRLQILHAPLKVTTGQQIPHEVASNLKHLSSFRLLIVGYDGPKNEYSYDFECLPDKLFPKILILLNIQSPILISIIDILPKGLQSLSCYQVEGLTNLKMVEFSMLRILKVCGCNEISYLFGADAELSKLGYMMLINLPLLEGICGPKEIPKIMPNVSTSTTSRATKTPLFPPQELVGASASSSQLRVLVIAMLPRLTSVFPSLSLYKQTPTSLRELNVKKCENLEEVIASAEEGDEMDVAYNPTTTLSLEELYELPRLMHFYGGKHALNFPLLRGIYIVRCDSLVSLAAMSGEDLGRLEEVKIGNCEGMKYVFAADVELSALWRLNLISMPGLEDICGHDGRGALWKNSFPALRYLRIESLPKIMNNNITNSHEGARKYLFGPEDVLPAIEIVNLVEVGCAEIWHYFPPATAGSFSRLSRLEIKTLPHIKHVFPSLAFCTHLLTRLREAIIRDCENLEEVVYGGDDEQVEDNQRAIISVIPALQKITLYALPKLKHFYGGRHTLKFPPLDTLELSGCKSMKSFTPMLPDVPNPTRISNDESTPEISMSKIMEIDTDSHEAARKYLFGHEDVLPAIEHMYLTDMGCAEIWHLPPATGSSFSQLSYLKINRLPHIKYVFPSLALCTHLLTGLKWLQIWGCENLEEVVYGGDDEQVENKDDVVNQRSIINSVIPALKEIRLSLLPRLKHFYGGRHTLKFPNLRKVDITKCESMECFATIPPDAPKLEDAYSLQNKNMFF